MREGWICGIVSVLLLVVTGGCQAWPTSRPLLIDKGEALAEIVIAEQPTRMQTLAAEELQAYLVKLTGVTLPIVSIPTGPRRIYVGQSTYTDELGITADGLTHGAFTMVSGRDYLVLLGDDTDFVPGPYDAQKVADRATIRPAIDELTKPDKFRRMVGPYMDRDFYAEEGWWKQDKRGSLNAVYQFLRQLGVRWYMPGEIGEIVPKLEQVALPNVKTTVRPDFGLRWHKGARYDRISRDEILWQYRLGLNYGRELLGDTGASHGLTYVHGRDETKQEHPEYYALKADGSRWADYLSTGAACLSSEELFEATVRYCRFIYDVYDEPSVPISIVDNWGKSGNHCHCEACMAQYTPDRVFGKMSDYAWGFYDRVARELMKTHPDRYVVALAYQQALLPPLSIDQLSPNLTVGIAVVNRAYEHPKAGSFNKPDIMELRRGWAAKTTSGRMFTWDYYLTYRPQKGPYDGVPAYYPHAIANDLRGMKTIEAMQGDHLEMVRNLGSELPDDAMPWGLRNELYATEYAHLNLWLTARLYWDVDQNVDAMLAEYFQLFYGPAAEEMERFVSYCEANWPAMGPEAPEREVIETAQRLIQDARTAAGDSVYGQRIEPIIAFMEPLKGRRPPVRESLATLVAPPRPLAELSLDGRLDDTFWSALPSYSLAMVDGTTTPPQAPTTFKLAWADDALILAVRCSDPDMERVRPAGEGHDDRQIFGGDVVEILIETQTHAHYQLVINPAGLLADLDRELAPDWSWTSQAEVAAQRDGQAWTLEVKIPVDDSGELDADDSLGLSGRQPTELAPWYVNICRYRKRGKETELTAFSPTIEGGFHVRHRFVPLLVPEPE